MSLCVKPFSHAIALLQLVSGSIRSVWKNSSQSDCSSIRHLRLGILAAKQRIAIAITTRDRKMMYFCSAICSSTLDNGLPNRGIGLLLWFDEHCRPDAIEGNSNSVLNFPNGLGVGCVQLANQAGAIARQVRLNPLNSSFRITA